MSLASSASKLHSTCVCPPEVLQGEVCNEWRCMVVCGSDLPSGVSGQRLSSHRELLHEGHCPSPSAHTHTHTHTHTHRHPPLQMRSIGAVLVCHALTEIRDAGKELHAALLILPWPWPAGSAGTHHPDQETEAWMAIYTRPHRCPSLWTIILVEKSKQIIFQLRGAC